MLFTVLGGIFLLVAIVLFFMVSSDITRFVLCLCFGIMGTVFTTLGAILCRILFKNSARSRERLMQNGERIIAHVDSCEPNTTISINGRCPYRLVCRYSENGIANIYRSENIWNYPRLLSENAVIYRNPAKPGDYYVELEGLIERTVEH